MISLHKVLAAGKRAGWGAYNTKLKDGVDVGLGGGLRQFKPTTVAGGERADGCDLVFVKEMQDQGYNFVLKRYSSCKK